MGATFRADGEGAARWEMGRSGLTRGTRLRDAGADSDRDDVHFSPRRRSLGVDVVRVLWRLPSLFLLLLLLLLLLWWWYCR